ncbi:MAG: adenylate/guanylate cyclase domain-containing protein [bacterium]
MPLKFKIALFVVLLTVIVTGVAGVLITGRMESSLRREIEMRGEALARNLAANVEDPLSQGDDLYIARFTTGAMDNPGVVYAIVVGGGGRIVGYRDAAHEDFTDFLGKPYEPPAGVQPLGKREFLSQTYDAPQWGPVYDVAVPVMLAGQKAIGVVHVGISQEGVKRAVNRTRITIGAITAAAVLLALLGSFVLAGFITRPIDRLMAGVREIQKGNGYAMQLPITTSDEVGHLTRAFNDMVKSLGEKELIKEAFSRYVSRQVASLILDEPDKYISTLKGQRKTITVLFADIRGFTRIAEALAPEQVVAMLNVYLTYMTDVVFRYEGTLDKFLGDGLMAIFGAPVEQPNSTLNAVRAALDMRERLRKFNLAREIGGEEPVLVGIGVNYGDAIVGNIGSRERMDYSVIGDTVNVAQRIQTYTEGGQIILAEPAYRRVEEYVEVKSLGLYELKGRRKKVEMFEVINLKEGLKDSKDE